MGVPNVEFVQFEYIIRLKDSDEVFLLKGRNGARLPFYDRSSEGNTRDTFQALFRIFRSNFIDWDPINSEIELRKSLVAIVLAQQFRSRSKTDLRLIYECIVETKWKTHPSNHRYGWGKLGDVYWKWSGYHERIARTVFEGDSPALISTRFDFHDKPEVEFLDFDPTLERTILRFVRSKH